MAQQQHLNRFNHDSVTLVAVGSELEFKLGTDADTATTRYLDMGDTDNGLQGFALWANQDLSIIEVNNQTLKVPRSVGSGQKMTLQRGDWHQIKIQTAVASTTVSLDVVS